MCPIPTIAARFPRERGAFTLIELLIVIAIISILMALLFPVMGMVRSRMDSAQCLRQLGQIGTAMAAYSNDHDGMMPGPLSFKQSATYLPGQAGSLAALLENYLGTATSTAPDGTSRYSPLFSCPAAARKLNDPTKASYLMNMLQMPETGQSVWGDIASNQKPLPKATLVDWNNATDGGHPTTVSEIWAIQDADQAYVAQAAQVFSGATDDLLPTPAHVDHYNDLFFDFHAASRTSLLTVDLPASPSPKGSP